MALAKVIACFVSDPDDFDVRSSVVLHEDDDPSKPFGVVSFGFSDDDREAIYLEHDLTALVYEAHRTEDLPSAEAMAREWVAGGETVEFRYLPGIYQAAFVEFLTGVRQEPHESHFAWALPPTGDMHPLRKFPPDANADTKENRNFVLMPRYAVDALYKSRGW